MDSSDRVIAKEASNINAYLAAAPNVVVAKSTRPISDLKEMTFGNMPNDGGHLLLTPLEARQAIDDFDVDPSYIRPFVGSHEFIQGIEKRCIWIESTKSDAASVNKWLMDRFNKVKLQRLASDRQTTRDLAASPFRFGEVRQRGTERTIVMPGVSSQARPFLPCGLLSPGTIISNKNFALYDADLWNIALLGSRMHLVWIATVCVRLRTDFSYSNTLGWNTFPVPTLTDEHKANLTRCAEDILLAREAHFPATIADMYDPEAMDTKYPDLRAAHDRNDETLERIYIGRRFRNDTERLEKLFELYTQMTSRAAPANGAEKPGGRKKKR